MKVIEGSGSINTGVVCCLHGDERLGAKVFNYFKNNNSEIEGLRIIFANEAAYAINKRFIAEDLNRCFPGDEKGTDEYLLASRLTDIVKNLKYVLDIHTTTSDVRMTPIVCNLSENTKKIINKTSSFEVALMSPNLSRHSLIGQTKAGVSLEYGVGVAEDEALEEITGIINKLKDEQMQSPQKRRIFVIETRIPLDADITGARNFSKMEELGVYPFLLKEKSYTTNHGFGAKKYTEQEI